MKSHSACVGCDRAVFILFVFVLFHYSTNMQVCCYNLNLIFRQFLFANNLARSSSVIQLGCFVAWSDVKGTGHRLSTIFGVSVRVQTQSVR